MQKRQPEYAAGREVGEVSLRLRRLERRDWWLWVAAFAVLLLLTFAVSSLSLPGPFRIEDEFFHFHNSLAVRGLWGLVLLFIVYTGYQHWLIKHLRRQLADQVAETAQAEVRAQEFERLAILDPLTGFYNRRFAEHHLQVEFSRADRFGYSLILLAIDIDKLKTINDRYGHPAGDLVLREFAQRLKKGLRNSDLPVRMGGDEFLAVLPRCRPEQVPYMLARIGEVKVDLEGKEIPIQFSVGWAEYQTGDTPEQLFVRADQSLYSNKETGKLEEQIRQLRKTETMGRMAGGVVHDFGNLLTTIKGYSELALDEIPQNHSQRQRIEDIHKTAERAAALVRQLMAFSRNEVLAPEPCDLNSVVASMKSILATLGGRHIELVFVQGPALGRVMADRGQLEQVIMNLAVNARDAMPQGGKLTISTKNIELDEPFTRSHPGSRLGPYVSLAISDGGSGMDTDTQAHLFEPFFTTKEKGKGTGLGLAVVYGIVKQSGGYIWVESELGRGTTFTIYWPRRESLEESPTHLPTTLSTARNGFGP